VSIEENNTLVQQVYPNPFQNYLTIQLKNNESATYEVISSNGKQVLSGQLMTGSTISTENLPKGIYFLKVQNQVQQSVQKLIKY
ncbi:MAG TPA: T9SS type A sorting domain-containing protein, partial [Vicingaceae bacterium]|nr:T9SS type A sorting domain-containing protein [Vicingaceae bacterium]